MQWIITERRKMLSVISVFLLQLQIIWNSHAIQNANQEPKENEGHEISPNLSSKQGLRPTSENLRNRQRFQFFKSKQVSPEILDASFGWSNETGDNAPI